MPAAVYLFFAGILLGLLCGFRINVRAFQWMDARWPRNRPSWDPTHLILGLRLKDTLGWEIAGLAIALVAITVAIQFLKPA